MNVSLGTTVEHENFGGTMESIQDEIEEHQEILASLPEIDILGPAVLIPEGKGYPGSYQVWSPVHYHDGSNLGIQLWAYVDTEGTVQYRSDQTLIKLVELIQR